VDQTNSVNPGYRVTQVKDGTSGSVEESYVYDNSGLVTASFFKIEAH
jgi:hypothetical protein